MILVGNFYTLVMFHPEISVIVWLTLDLFATIYVLQSEDVFFNNTSSTLYPPTSICYCLIIFLWLAVFSTLPLSRDNLYVWAYLAHIYPIWLLIKQP